MNHPNTFTEHVLTRESRDPMCHGLGPGSHDPMNDMDTETNHPNALTDGMAHALPQRSHDSMGHGLPLGSHEPSIHGYGGEGSITSKGAIRVKPVWSEQLHGSSLMSSTHMVRYVCVRVGGGEEVGGKGNQEEKRRKIWIVKEWEWEWVCEREQDEQTNRRG